MKQDSSLLHRFQNANDSRQHTIVAIMELKTALLAMASIVAVSAGKDVDPNVYDMDRPCRLDLYELVHTKPGLTSWSWVHRFNGDARRASVFRAIGYRCSVDYNCKNFHCEKLTSWRWRKKSIDMTKKYRESGLPPITHIDP